MKRRHHETIQTPENSEAMNSNHCSKECSDPVEQKHKKFSLKANDYDETETTTEGPSNKDKDNDSLETKNEKGTEFSSLVAAHYNASFPQIRKESRIFYLRNFNNWIKSLLIKECAYEMHRKKRSGEGLQVLDMCCGKGGDLFKWIKLKVSRLICTDIAENTLKEFESRFQEYLQRKKERRLKCDFIPADCTRVRLKEKYDSPNTIFDIVSCQFSFHYCFESLPQAECMLRNASECLRLGGLFLGTLPIANEIVKRIKQSKRKNKIYSIEMCCEEPYPLFGAKYNFYLEGVVDCPEFLVHFPTFERLASKYGFKLLRKEKFTDFFEKRKSTWLGKDLLRRIEGLETYSTSNADRLQGPEYYHAKLALEGSNLSQVGTLSKSEWEVVSLYQTFVYEKQENVITPTNSSI